MTDNVLTLIATRDAAAEAEAAVNAVTASLIPLGAHLLERQWLAPRTACDLHFSDLDADQAEAAGRAALTPRFGAIDVVVQPATGRRKQLLVADLESTIIANEMLDELADCVGLRREVAEITRRAMNDEIDFAQALRERVALLKGLPEIALEEAAQRIRLIPGARALVATMRANGAYAVLVSGGFSVYTGRIRQLLGFDHDVANELIIENAQLSGRVREPILAREAKLEALKTMAAERGLSLSASLAVGDGANDMAMVDAAGLGIAFHAKPALAARARHRIDHADLTAVLYAQGYRAAEIVGVD
jgi:phosphoserine phosphatase